jgi:hypothetical protein
MLVLNFILLQFIYLFIYFILSNIVYSRVQKNQLAAQLILSIYRQPLHVSGVSRPIIRRYNRMYTTVGTYYSFQMTLCCPGWFGTIQLDAQLILSIHVFRQPLHVSGVSRPIIRRYNRMYTTVGTYYSF